MILLLLILGTALVLGGLLTAAALFVQPYLYSETVKGVVWRGPVAGAAIALIVGLWVFLARGAPDGRYQTLLLFSARDTGTTFQELVLVDRDGTKVPYRRVPGRTGREAFARNGRPGKENAWPSRPATIFAREGGQEVEFKPDRDAKGNFRTIDDQPLAYRDAKGRVMTEDYPGEINSFRWGQLFVNLLLNLVFFLVMFAVLWLLLEYHFWHAFGFALALWGVMILFVLPPMIGYAETLGTR